MAEDNSVSFITEDVPPSPNFIQSGKSLRLCYVNREESKFITETLISNAEAEPGEEFDFAKLPLSFWENSRETWRQEAVLKYPDEGDYLVWIVDPITGDPVPLGEVVEFIGGIRDNTGSQECVTYVLDLTGVDSETVILISYEDCFIQAQNVEGSVAELDGLEICVGRGIPVVNEGVFNEGAVCNTYMDVCAEYTFDFTGVPPFTVVTLEFTDCDNLPVSIEGAIERFIEDESYCMKIESGTITQGELVLGDICVL
jgi:hypothetical protein